MFFFLRLFRYQLLELVRPGSGATSFSGQSDLDEDNCVEIRYEENCDNPENSWVDSKMTILDVDQSNVSDRPEWGHLKYQASYNPSR